MIDTIALSASVYKIILDLHKINDDERRRLINDMISRKNVEVDVFLQSNMDMEISLCAKSPRDFYDFYEYLSGKYAKYMKRKHISFVTKQYYLGNRFLVSGNEKIIVEERATPVKIDAVEEKIIEKLKEDARASVLNIAKAIKLAPSSTVYRLREIKKKKIIKGYEVRLNANVLGYDVFRVLLALADVSKKKQVVAYLESNPEVTKISEMIGEYDLEFDVVFQTSTDLDQFLSKLRYELPYIEDFQVINIIQQ